MKNSQLIFTFPDVPTKSRYIRTTWMLSADKLELTLPDSSKIRFFTEEEAGQLTELMRQKNVFVRHSREYGFYWQRVNDLVNHTVIDVSFAGYPKEASEKVWNVAGLIEILVVLSTSLALRRKKLQRMLGVSSKSQSVDFCWEPNLKYFSSKMHTSRPATGIPLDERLCNRFSRCDFQNLYEYCLSDRGIAKRVILSLSWLFESIREPTLNSAVVKTSISLESLLIFNATESLAQSLSERTAFILSSLDP